MGYIFSAESIFAQNVSGDSAFIDTLKYVEKPFLDGIIPHMASEFSDHSSRINFPNQPVWYFVLIFLLFASIALSQIFFGHVVRGTFQTAVRYSVTVGMFKDNSLIERQKDNILYLIYFLTFAFFLLFIEIRFSVSPFKLTGFPLFLWNIAFLVAVFFLRVLLVNLIAHIFNRRILFREYLYHSFSLNKLFGLIFVPLVFLLAYTRDSVLEISFYISLGMLFILFAMKIMKGIIFAIEKHVFNFYLFLYLCALEIVPILLIYKWISTIV